MVGGLKPDGTLVQCKQEGKLCAHYRAPGGKLFGPELIQIPPDERFAKTVREMGQRSLPPTANAALQIPLIAKPLIHVPQTDWLWVQSVSQLALGPDMWIEVDMEVESRGPTPVKLNHRVKVGGSRFLLKSSSVLDPGQVFRLRYTLTSDIPLTRSSIRTRARLTGPGEADLVFRKRRFEIKRAGERPRQGLQLAHIEMDPPPEGPLRLQYKVNSIQDFSSYFERRAKQGYREEAAESVDEEEAGADGF